MNEEQVRQLIRQELERFLKIDRFVFDKNIQILDARNIQLGKTNGTKIGTEGGASGQKLGFFDTTPVVQQPLISDPSGSVSDLDQEARTAIVALIDMLVAYGLLRSS